MKKNLLIIITVLGLTAAQAQFYNDGLVTNDGSLISDWQSQWFNTTNGVYNGNSNGVFEHHGPSSQTFINNGTYNALTGHTDQFLGPLGVSGGQEIGGSIRPFFFNLLLNNGATDNINITNTDGANVRGVATFNNGITTTIHNIHQAGALRFEDGATYTGGNSDAQHVNGYVSKTGNDGFVYPVGSGTDIRTVSISAPASVTDEISVAWFAGDPSVITDPSDLTTHSITSVMNPVIAVSAAGFWDWINVTGSDDNVIVTASIPDMTAFAAAANLRLVGWNGTAWIDLSGGATASGNTENSTLSGTIPAGITITAIAIGSNSFILPVELLSFTVQTGQNCDMVIRWSTASEQNSAYFEVERSSMNNQYIPIVRITAAGNSNQVRQYQVIDKHAINGLNYYRIKQVDMDGRISYSSIRTINSICAGTQDIFVYPTITNGPVTIQLAPGHEQIKLKVYNAVGQPMIVTEQGVGLYRNLDLSKLPAGIYIIQVRNDKWKEKTFKITLQK
jgi:hypothetical protein